MTKTNKFGLVRDIKAEVALEVRKRCGFGCIICGSMFCDYHHIYEYHDIEEHDPDKIVLLCKSHHGDVTAKNPLNRRISDDTLFKYKKLPYAMRKGHVHWTNLTDIKGVKLGRFFFENTRTIMRIDGNDVLSLHPVEGDFPIMGLRAKFFDYNGRKTLEVRGNIVLGEADSWDLKSVGNLITINNAPGDVVLSIRLINDGVVEVERLKMQYLNGAVEVMPNGSVVTSFNGEVRVKTMEARIVGADVGIDLKNGLSTLGKAERTTLAKGASEISFRPSKSRVCGDDGSATPYISESGLPRGRFDFEGVANGNSVKIKGMSYSNGITPVQVEQNSLRIGVIDDAHHGNNSMHIEEIKIKP